MIRRLLIAATIGLAFILTVFSLEDCEFWKSTSESGSSGGAGIFKFSYRHKQCIRFSLVLDWAKVQLSHSTKFAQAMGVMAGIFGGVAVLLTLFGSCVLSFLTFTKRTWRRTIAVAIWLAFVCQAFTFFILKQAYEMEKCGQDDTECTLGFGGYCSIVACLLYFLAGVFVTFLSFQPPKENPHTTYLARLGTRCMKSMGLSWKTDRFQILRWQDLALLLFSVILLANSVGILIHCKFYKVSFQNNTKEYYEGLFRYYYYPDDKCRTFEKGSFQSFTAQTMAGNVFGALAAVMAIILLYLLVNMTLVFYVPTKLHNWLAPLSFLSALCQSLVFLGNSERNDILCAEDIEDQSCQMGSDAYVNLVNTILYLLFVPALIWFRNHPNNESIHADEDMEEPAAEQELGKDVSGPNDSAGTANDRPPPGMEPEAEPGDGTAKNAAIMAQSKSLLTGDANKLD